MKKVMIIALIIVGLLFVPAVSAYDYSETFTETHYKDGWAKFTYSSNVIGATVSFDRLHTNKIQDFVGIKSIVTIFDSSSGTFPKSGTGQSTSFIGYIGDTQICTGTIGYNVNHNPDGSWKNTIYYIMFDDFDPKEYSGSQYITLEWDTTTVPKPTYVNFPYRSISSPNSASDGYSNSYIAFAPSNKDRIPMGISTQYYVSHDWSNTVGINDYKNYLDVYIEKELSGSHVTIVDSISNAVLYSKTSTNDEYVRVYSPKINISITSLLNTYYVEYSGYTPDPGETSTLRTGTVTMTDNNGTAISGFAVTAINHYTGEEFTTSTQSDVAVITLPMDRTVEIRNPQTGVYEEAPVGYYRFYGQSPGYKMLHEDGIQVSVMPEKYGSYQLCDIRVTQESGYLTGKHQFQIRSRSDNSILQSGTISAKSATTGEWYNATVSGGIATLILPYDTSNVVSQYAGNYYVYATSPGYEDSDYGTQIVVMPHTVSQIQTVHLTPIGGIPPAGNVTLRIQVFSETGQGIPNAEIFIAGVLGAGADVWDTYNASSTGYLTVSVPANSTYDIVASGAGYYDSARRVEVFTEDPALIEIKLYLSGAPTIEPTTQPTGWVTPPPTQTTPPIQEDNLIGLSVKGLAKGFGIDYDTALLMFGLMIIFGAGGMVMSSVKGGAMEFIAGSIVGTFVAFALGLIPIWIFIIIAVVFGAYVLRVFVQGSQ